MSVETYTEFYNDNPAELPLTGDEILVATQNGHTVGLTTKDIAQVGGEPIAQRNLTTDLTLEDGECLVLVDYLNNNGHDVTLKGDAVITMMPEESVVVEEIVEGENITVDNTNPRKPIVSASPGGGGVSLESYQNSAMSAAVMAYVFRDESDNIYRVYEPIRGNDIQRSQLAYADSVDKVPFDSANWFDNNFSDVKLVSLNADVIFKHTNIAFIAINCNNHTGARFENYNHRGFTEGQSPFNHEEIYITGDNFYLHDCTFLGSDICIDSPGDNCEVAYLTALNDQQFINFGGFESCFCGDGILWEDLTNIIFREDNSYFTDFQVGGSTTIYVPSRTGGTSYGFVIGDFCTLGDVSARYKLIRNLKLGNGSTLIPTTDIEDSLLNVDIGMNCTITTTGDKSDWNVKNINGTAYELGVTAGAVTATPV